MPPTRPRLSVAVVGLLLSAALGGAAPSAEAVAPAVVRSELLRGQSLLPGQTLTSPDGRFSLEMPTVGQLTAVEQPNRLESTGYRLGLFAGFATSNELALQADGNLVLHQDGELLSFGTDGTRAARLVVQDDGGVVLYDDAGAPVRTVFGGLVTFGLAFQSSVQRGQALLPGTAVGVGTTLAMQGDGNLVLSAAGRPVWSSRTSGHPGAAAVLQSDGNLVVYAAGTPLVPLWASGSVSPAPVDLELGLGDFRVLQDDRFTGVLSLFGSAWTSDTLPDGQVLVAGDRRTSPGQGCVLLLQADADLVARCAGRVVFASRTSGAPYARTAVTMQADGNVVMTQRTLEGTTRVVWSTLTYGHPGSRTVIQDDGNLVVYSPQGVPLFHSR